MLYSVLRFLAKILCIIIFRVEIEGRENIPKKGGFILAGNHSSYLDPILLGIACPRKLNYLARDNLFHNRFSSWLLTSVGCIPLRRNSADLSAIKKAMNALKGGGGLVMFPQGTRNSKSDKALPGIGFLLAKSGLPVVPAFIKGADLALPKSSRFIKPKKINVYFGREIFPERSKSHDYQDIADRVMRGIGHLACR